MVNVARIPRDFDDLYDYDKETQKVLMQGIAMKADLQNAGPVAILLEGMQKVAFDALTELATADPKDAMEISRLQQMVTQYRETAALTAEIIHIGEDILSEEDANETVEDQ